MRVRDSVRDAIEILFAPCEADVILCSSRLCIIVKMVRTVGLSNPKKHPNQPLPKRPKTVVVDDEVVGDTSNATIENVVEMDVVADVHQPSEGVNANVVQLAVAADVDQPSHDITVVEDEVPEKQISASQEAEDKKFSEMVRWKAECLAQIEKRTKNIAFLQAQLKKEEEAKNKWEKRLAADKELFR